MTHANQEPMADVRDMYMAHTMFRREFRLLPQLIRDVAPGDTRRATIVADHAEMICLALEAHHEGEDLLLWPKLLERGGAASAAIVPMIEKQHLGIHDALVEVRNLLPAWRASGRDGER